MKNKIWKRLVCLVLVFWMMVSMAFVTTVASSPDEYEEPSPCNIITAPKGDD